MMRSIKNNRLYFIETDFTGVDIRDSDFSDIQDLWYTFNYAVYNDSTVFPQYVKLDRLDNAIKTS